jgi:hypothetical protein
MKNDGSVFDTTLLFCPDFSSNVKLIGNVAAVESNRPLSIIALTRAACAFCSFFDVGTKQLCL